jgi:hypothetical protein
MYDIDVRASGPMTNGRSLVMLAGTERDIELDAARHTEHLVQARLSRVLQNPTGRFQSTVHVVHSADPYVDGEGTVYGRWLEGVGSRNRTTRFKGYYTFRIVAQQAERDSGGIAERHTDMLARRL